MRRRSFVLLALWLAGAAARAASLPVARPLPPAVPPPVPETAVSAAVAQLYAGAGARRYWSGPAGVTPTGRAVLEELALAGQRGLRPADYDAEGLAARAASLAGLVQHGTAPDAASLAGFDHDLSRAAARFIAHLQQGRVRPQAAGYALDVPRAPLDLAAAVAALAASNAPAAALDAWEPRYRHFPLLKAALAHYRQLARELPPLELPALSGRSIRPGESWAGAAALRQWLARLGDLAPDAPAAADPAVMDAALVAGLARFQQRHGLPGDGVLGAATWRALRVPLSVRVRQIELAMERVRWLPPPPGGPFIIVNIPEFRLFAFRGPDDREQAMTAMNVIVGRTFPQTNTPVFMASMRYVAFRPYWDVPASIMRKEVLPQLRKDLTRAARDGYELVRGQGDDSPVVAMSTQGLDALERGELRIRQRPGPKNALGEVKFMLPNRYDVYLHSTPAQRLFGEAQRAFSHGCVRVEDPVALAQFVFADEPAWTRERIVAAMTTGAAAQRVNLRHEIPVVMFYATALAAEDGRVLFFEDLYGHDRRLEALLGAGRQ